MIPIILLILLCFDISLLAGEKPQEITFAQLTDANWIGREVIIRGFLYKKDGLQILASEPNLKTCCIGAAHKKDNQVVIQNPLPDHPLERTVRIKGRLAYNKGALSYSIEDASIMAEEKSSRLGSLLILGLIGLGIVLFKSNLLKGWR